MADKEATTNNEIKLKRVIGLKDAVLLIFGVIIGKHVLKNLLRSVSFHLI